MGIIKKGDLNVNMNESILRLQGAVQDTDCKYPVFLLFLSCFTCISCILFIVFDVNFFAYTNAAREEKTTRFILFYRSRFFAAFLFPIIKVD